MILKTNNRVISIYSTNKIKNICSKSDKINVRFYILFHKNYMVLLFACAYRLGTEYAALTNCKGRRFISRKA